MGEAFLRQHLADRGVEHVEVSSAGTHAQVGRPAMSDAQDAVRAIRGDAGGHVARQLEISTARASDLILCAAEEHRRHILSWWPELGADRVRLFNESIAGRAPLDVDDPYGWDAHVFMLAARVIDRALDAWADEIAQRWPARA
jgi:protein-tyrosine phosphatase